MRSALIGFEYPGRALRVFLLKIRYGDPLREVADGDSFSILIVISAAEVIRQRGYVF